jgi:hypothetical protein
MVGVSHIRQLHGLERALRSLTRYGPLHSEHHPFPNLSHFFIVEESKSGIISGES